MKSMIQIAAALVAILLLLLFLFFINTPRRTDFVMLIAGTPFFSPHMMAKFLLALLFTLYYLLQMIGHDEMIRRPPIEDNASQPGGSPAEPPPSAKNTGSGQATAG
jgi:hypothetical protein